MPLGGSERTCLREAAGSRSTEKYWGSGNLGQRPALGINMKSLYTALVRSNTYI
jgi:hypothetical protein